MMNRTFGFLHRRRSSQTESDCLAGQRLDENVKTIWSSDAELRKMLHPLAPQRFAILHARTSNHKRAPPVTVPVERSVAVEQLLPELVEGRGRTSLQREPVAFFVCNDEVERVTPMLRIVDREGVAGPRQSQTQLARQLGLEYLVQALRAPVQSALVNLVCGGSPRQPIAGVGVEKIPLRSVQRDRRSGRREAAQLCAGP